MTLEPGLRFGPYEILAPLGAGGMGEVWRARDTRLDRQVAIKVLPERVAGDQDALARFEREARAVAALSHPNILAIYDVGADQGISYVVTELLEGETLRERLRRAALPWQKAVEVGAAVADGLAAAHAKGVIHRDLKPENIFLTDDGVVKILDFGLARMDKPSPPKDQVSSQDRAAAATVTLDTKPGAVFGTVHYMSPEQVRGHKTDARSDIFSFGCVLYEMLTGRRPFSGDTSADTMTAILKEEPPRVASLAPDVPPELVRVISRCLEKKAEHRIQSARDLGYALRDILADSGASRPSVTVAAPSRRSMVGVYVALGLTAVVALLFASNVGGLRERLFYSPDSRRIDSLAVLPLKNLSGDPEQEYFADGMTEALISELAKIGALKVISRTSAMQYKGATKPMPQIARELGVSALIEGSVVREGDQIRITVQMIHGPTDEHLWAETYQREMRGVLALQSEVARAIAREIRVVVTPEEETRLAAARPVNPEAHELYLRGRYHWTKRSEEGLSRAIQFFQQAIDIDPAYARAHAGLADVYVVQPMLGFAPPLEGFPRGRAAAIKALELDEHLAEAYATLGHIKSVYDRDWSGAEQDHKRALELNPNYATAHYWYGMLLSAWGRHEGAIAELEIAVKLDPLAPIISAMLGKVLYHARRYDEAAQQLRKTVDMHPDFYPAHLGLGWTYAQMGMHPEALAAVEKAKAEGLPEVYPEYGYVGWIYARAGRQDEAQRVLDRLRERSSVRYIDPGGIALIHIGLGQNEQAITWLERAYEHRGSLVILRLKVHPVFDPLREDPRFQDLLRRMNFTE